MNRLYPPAIWAVLLLVSLTGCSYLSVKSSEKPFGKRFQAALDQAPRKRQTMLDRLLEPHTFPVCTGNRCFFFYRGNPDLRISVAGDWNGWKPDTDRMRPIEGTDYYYLVKEFPSDARLDYKIVVNGEWLLDPRNPRTCPGAVGKNSVLAMPAYVEPEELQPHDTIPRGTIEVMNFESTILDGTRRVAVYMPPGYGRQYGPHPFLIVLDGSDYEQKARVADIVDVLVADGKIRRPVIVFVDPENREQEYGESDKYLEFIVEEIIPYLRAHYDVEKTREECGILGASLGGYAAFRAAWRYPATIGKMAGQSCYFGENDELIETVKTAPPKPIQFYFDIGTFETTQRVNLLEQNRRMRSALESKGYSVTYGEYNEGHSWGSWRAHIDTILVAFWPRVPA